jgi:hypothetical protein
MDAQPRAKAAAATSAGASHTARHNSAVTTVAMPAGAAAAVAVPLAAGAVPDRLLCVWREEENIKLISFRTIEQVTLQSVLLFRYRALTCRLGNMSTSQNEYR